MIYQRYKSLPPKRNNINNNTNINININNNNNDNEKYRDDKKDNNKTKNKDKLVIAGNEYVHVNDAKLGALLYFPLIGIVVTSCLGDMYHRNSTMHREPNAARALLVDCPVKDPDHVWLLLVCCYLVIVVSIGVLCHTMLGLNFSLVGTARSTRMRVVTCRICLILFYCGFYNWDMCMGTMPYLKKATVHVYYACIVLFISSPTLSMPLIVHTSKSSPLKPPRWPLFLIKMMVFIAYADSGWHKLHLDFTGTTLRACLIHHWIYFERPIAILLLDHPVLTSASAIATLIFECAGWILLCFDYDRVAAIIALNFHIGIYLAMNVDFITFWSSSFVFFFVPSIISSTAFQRLLKRPGTLNSVSVPLGSSLLVGINGENKDVPSTVSDSVMNGGSNSKSRRKRKSSVFMAVSCALLLTYTGFYPYSMILPDMTHSLSPSFLSTLYEQLSGMIFKPFNSYTMYARGDFPVGLIVAFLVLKRRTSEVTATEHEPVAPYRRVKWIPTRASDFYFYTNMLNSLDDENKDETFTLDSLNNNTGSQRTVTRCNIFACLAQHYILSESAGDGTKDGPRGIRREVADDGPWDVDSIELVKEWYMEPTALALAVEAAVAEAEAETEVEGADDYYNANNANNNDNDNDNDANNNNNNANNNNNNGYDVLETSDTRSLRKGIVPYCALDIGGDSPQQTPRELRHFDGYEDGSCGDILAELDASALSSDASLGLDNPFYLMTVRPRIQKYKYEDPEMATQVGMGTVIMVMLIVGYKTYLLAR